MRKVVLYIAQSIDGFIATKTGGVDWLTPDKNGDNNNDYGYSDFYKTIDTTLMGHNTYKEILSFDVPFPYPDKKNYVFSRSGLKTGEPPVEFITTDPAAFVAKIKKKPGKNIWLIGGGQINKILLDANLIDEIILSVRSVVLGDGIKLFSSETAIKEFSLIKTVPLDQHFAQLILSKKS